MQIPAEIPQGSGKPSKVNMKFFAMSHRLVSTTRQDLFVISACLAFMEVHPKELLRTASPVPVL